MTGRATFGDFLHAAYHAFTGRGRRPIGGYVEEVSRSLLAVVTIVGR